MHIWNLLQFLEVKKTMVAGKVESISFGPIYRLFYLISFVWITIARQESALGAYCNSYNSENALRASNKGTWNSSLSFSVSNTDVNFVSEKRGMRAPWQRKWKMKVELYHIFDLYLQSKTSIKHDMLRFCFTCCSLLFWIFTFVYSE
jgi:hypothetical protein